uniref:Uncharacterized protein n=1 Tax=Pongo abelii TaxID=9601 RepID=H2NJE8_PONAB
VSLAARNRGRLSSGTEGSSSCAAHPALAEQVQAAALGLDIEGGAHGRPAGADPSGPDPGFEDSPARPPGRQSCCSGSQAAQPSDAQHSITGAVPSSNADPRPGAFARSAGSAFPRQQPTPPHVTAPLPGLGAASGRGHVVVQRARASLPLAFSAALRPYRPLCPEILSNLMGTSEEGNLLSTVSPTVKALFGKTRVSPIFPFSPRSPFQPLIPRTPGSPWSPMGLASPLGPGFPIGPMGPGKPVGPKGPMLPLGPSGPVGPTSPLFPFCP